MSVYVVGLGCNAIIGCLFLQVVCLGSRVLPPLNMTCPILRPILWQWALAEDKKNSPYCPRGGFLVEDDSDKVIDRVKMKDQLISARGPKTGFLAILTDGAARHDL